MPTAPEIQKQIDDFKQQKEKLDAEKQKLDSEKAVKESENALAQSQKDSSELKQLQDQKSLADAKKALADSQKALLDSQRAADQANSGSIQQLADLQNQKALADAQKGLADSKKALDQVTGSLAQQLSSLQNQKGVADAQKALADSQTQALLARFVGDVKAGPFTGSVELKDKAGTQEAALLAARAVQQAAALVAAAIPENIDSISIFAAKDFPNFQRLVSFRIRKELLKQAFRAAGVTVAQAGPALEDVVALPALVAGGLDAFSKLLGFFKTDFTTGGIDVKLDESLLLFAVAGQLHGRKTRLPLIYDPDARIAGVSAVAAQLRELADLRSRAASQVSQLNTQIDGDTKLLADPTNAAQKDSLTRQIGTAKASIDGLNGVMALYDGFLNGLTTPDSSGTVPIAALAQEANIDAALAGEGAVLLLRLESTGGGFLVKKNLWTGLGAMPLFHSGGATVTYLLLDGQTGAVISGNIVPVHGGFIASDKMPATLEKPIDSPSLLAAAKAKAEAAAKAVAAKKDKAAPPRVAAGNRGEVSRDSAEN